MVRDFFMKNKISKIQKQVDRKFNLFAFNFLVKAIKPFSRFFRRVFEASQIRQVFGVLVVSSFLSVSVLPSSYCTIQTKIDTNLTSVVVSDFEILETEQSVRLPVDSFMVTQGFSFFHPGLDLAAIKGSPVYPIMDGKVIAASLGRFGYGNHVLIDHGSGIKSLYAHLAKIEVQEGEKVTQQSIIGLIGSTGRSTGPHLHLQIFQDGHWENPRAFFEGYFGKKLASTR